MFTKVNRYCSLRDRPSGGMGIHLSSLGCTLEMTMREGEGALSVEAHLVVVGVWVIFEECVHMIA